MGVRAVEVAGAHDGATMLAVMNSPKAEGEAAGPGFQPEEDKPTPRREGGPPRPSPARMDAKVVKPTPEAGAAGSEMRVAVQAQT